MKTRKSWLIAGLGLAVMVLGGWQMESGSALAYLFIGIGAGLLGQGTGELIPRRALQDCPDIPREMEIAQKDERSQTIADRSKSKAFDMMTFAYGALMLSLGLMQVEMEAILMMVTVYLLVQGYALYWWFRYEKEM